MRRHPEDNDFVQAGDLYRVMKEDEHQRLVATIAGAWPRSAATTSSRSIAHFRAADNEYGDRIAAAVAAARRPAGR